MIDKSFCDQNPKYSHYNNDENNFLALSGDAHKWFDGIQCDLPLFNLKVVEESRRPVETEDNRYQVTLEVQAWDVEAARMLFCRLNEGAKKTENSLVMLTTVFVKDKSTFKKCIEWKAAKIASIWYPEGAIE